MLVKITDKSDYARFARPDAEDEGMWLDHVEVHLVTRVRRLAPAAEAD